MKSGSGEKMDEAVAGLIEKAMGGVDTAQEFLTAEIPDVVWQIVAWNIAYHTVWSVFCVVLLVVGILMMTRFRAKLEKSEMDEYNKDNLSVVLWVFGLIASIVAVPVTFYNLSQIVKLIVAPKVWLIEYAAQLLK